MSTNVLKYHNDGANYQAQAVLAAFKGALCDGLEDSWSDENKRYQADIRVGRWENCREQGYVLSLRNLHLVDQLNIAFFEHRNSDSICAIKWHQVTTNTPTIDIADFNDECYKDKWDTSFDVGHGEYDKMAEWLLEQFTDFWNKTMGEEMKAIDPEQLFLELDVHLDNGVGVFKGRLVRWLPDAGLFQVGEDTATFDRWSNSVDLEFELWQAKGQRAFLRWADSEL